MFVKRLGHHFLFILLVMVLLFLFVTTALIFRERGTLDGLVALPFECSPFLVSNGLS